MPYYSETVDPYFIPTATSRTVKVNAEGKQITINATSGPNCPISNVKFRWLDSMNQQRMQGHLMSFGKNPGYSICGKGLPTAKLKELAVDLGLNESYVDVGRGWICYGESVLAHIPVEEAVRRAVEASDRQKNRAAAAQNQELEMLDSTRGVRPIRKQVGQFHEERAYHERTGKPFISMTRS